MSIDYEGGEVLDDTKAPASCSTVGRVELKSLGISRSLS